MHSGKFTALLDANVLYPFLLRDLLLSLAQAYLYRPKWSKDIEDEWIKHLSTDRPDVDVDSIRENMKKAFEDAMVDGYQDLIDGLTLTDKDDRHVLAATIVSRSDVIVTYNLADFDEQELLKYNIEAVHPDDFIVNLIDLDEGKAKTAFEKMVGRRKNPPVDASELLKRMKKADLPKAADRFQAILI